MGWFGFVVGWCFGFDVLLLCCVLLFVMGLFVFSLMFGGVCFALMCGVVLGLGFGVVFCVVIFFCLWWYYMVVSWGWRWFVVMYWLCFCVCVFSWWCWWIVFFILLYVDGITFVVVVCLFGICCLRVGFGV